MDEKCIIAFDIESWRGNRKYPVVTPLIKIARLYIPYAFALLLFVVLCIQFPVVCTIPHTFWKQPVNQ
jgi:hypothetical protein